MSAMAYGRRDAAIAHHGRQIDLGSWRGARAHLVNDEGATARLVVSVQCGDTRAFDLLDRAFRPGLYQYLRATLRNADDAQEVTQLVFLRALEKIGTCRIGSESFAPWLYGIARN